MHTVRVAPAVRVFFLTLALEKISLYIHRVLFVGQSEDRSARYDNVSTSSDF